MQGRRPAPTADGAGRRATLTILSASFLQRVILGNAPRCGVSPRPNMRDNHATYPFTSPTRASTWCGTTAGTAMSAGASGGRPVVSVRWWARKRVTSQHPWRRAPYQASVRGRSPDMPPVRRPNAAHRATRDHRDDPDPPPCLPSAQAGASGPPPRRALQNPHPSPRDRQSASVCFPAWSRTGAAVGFESHLRAAPTQDGPCFPLTAASGAPDTPSGPGARHDSAGGAGRGQSGWVSPGLRRGRRPVARPRKATLTSPHQAPATSCRPRRQLT